MNGQKQPVRLLVKTNLGYEEKLKLIDWTDQDNIQKKTGSRITLRPGWWGGKGFGESAKAF